MKHNTIDKVIIDPNSNPFVHESWIEQGFGFTPKRQAQAATLLFHVAKPNINSK